jgi:hypothetical protein
MRSILFLAAVTSTMAAASSDAEACSPPLCRAGFFTPGDGATVPASVPGIHWRPMSGFDGSPAEPSKVVLASAAAPGTPLPFTAMQLATGGYLLVPDQPLAPGAAYVLADQNTCGGQPIGPNVTFQVADGAPLPASLGALVESANRVGPLTVAAGGPCSTEVDAHQIGIELQLAPEAIAWRDVLHFETLVDGTVWRAARSAVSSEPPGASWRGRGVDLLYRVCETDQVDVQEGLAAGPHAVVMRATLPGSGTVVQSSSLAVHIECKGDGSTDADGSGGGCDAGRSGSSGWLLLGSLLLGCVPRRGPRAGRARRDRRRAAAACETRPDGDRSISAPAR